ncbi:hypothetical protein [uncultured Jatrophihabitans sp.]|uniref:hypothetical protein n=1 Tax=uncultured Jatrophihabitans sp. TaxID=1610747 RepID=UPI0035CA3E9A
MPTARPAPKAAPKAARKAARKAVARPTPKPTANPASEAVATDGAELAERLLAAQVAWAVGELTGERLAAMLGRAVEDLLDALGGSQVADLVSPDDVRLTARRVLDQIVGSPLVTELAVEVADAVYDLAASDDHLLGDVVPRDPVVDLVAKLLSMRQLRDRALDRLTESPLVADVSAKFVGKIIADVVAQNRARAEKLPGMSSLLSLGSGAASRVRSVTDRHLDQLLGDAAGKGASFALRRTNNAARELIDDAPLHEAALELWDLHAEEPISRLREYLGKQDLRDLVEITMRLVSSARDAEWMAAALDAGVEVFFARYGDLELHALLAELGVDRDGIRDDIRRFAPPVLERLRADGSLERLVRERLEPFFGSAQVAELLGGN